MNCNRIWIIDEQFNFREGIKNLLEIRFPTSIINTFDSIDEKRIYSENELPNIVFLEPYRNLTFYAKVIDIFIEIGVKVIILTMESSKKNTLRLLKRNINGFLLKSVSTKELVRHLETIANGGRYIHPSAANILLDEYRKKDNNNVCTNPEMTTV